MPSVLIVDDDPKFAGILFDLIRDKGFKCILAEDGEAGLQMANQYKPSAIEPLNIRKIMRHWVFTAKISWIDDDSRSP